MPDVGAAGYLIGYLFECGPTVGENPLTWTEIRNWREETGVVLDEFDAGALMQLSRQYVGTLHQAREPDCVAPYQSEEVKAARKAASKAAGAPWRRGPGKQREKK